MVLQKTYTLESLEDLGKVNNDVIKNICDYLCLDDKTEYNIKLVISELVINGFIHGKNSDSNLQLSVTLSEDKALSITVDDGGIGFDAEHRKDVTSVDSERGRGLILVRAFTTRMIYNNSGNKVKVVIHLDSIDN